MILKNLQKNNKDIWDQKKIKNNRNSLNIFIIAMNCNHVKGLCTDS